MIGSCLEIVLALVAILPQTSTDVFFDSVGSIDGDSLFRCNSKATFICWASSDSVTFWVNETKAVECVFNCLPNKNVPGNYTFHHTAANLTIAAEVDNIGITEMKTTFECSSQNFPIRTKKPKVIIYPTNSSTNISTKDVESAVEIKVTTGCILPRNILSFVWDLTKKSDGTVLKPVSIQDLNFTENINQTDNSLCLPSANCGGNGVSTTLRFKPGNAGEDYLIQCTIIVNENVNGRAYNNFTIISDRTFQFIVPVLHVNLTTNITSLREEKGSVEENSTIQIQCITSYSRPRPEIILHGFSDIDILSPNCIQEYDTDGLIRTRCTYILKVTRKCDKSTLYCNATNMQHSVAVKSKPVTLNILYPPDGPPVIQNNVPGAVFTVIEFTKVVLTCTISNSNPGTNLTWICENNRATHFESNRNEISANISWTAERYQNTSCTCNAVYGLLTPWRTTINVDTLFPASITHLYLNGSQHTTIIQTIDVIENSTLMVKWDVEGNPIPNSYWLNASENSAEITFANVQRSLNGQVYEFRASNFMKPTTGNEQPGNDKKTVTLYVLYPPKIRPLRNISIIENRTLSQLCEIADGNPAAVTYYWTRMKKNEKNLTITNVNRSDQNWYQCRVNNTMMPTYGVVMYGEDVGQFYLHILYPPEDIQINSTSSPNHEVIDVIGVIENTELKLFCVAKGRPLPTNYSWSGIYASTTAEVNILGNRTKSGSLKCSVSNMMTELPNNKTEIGKGSKTVRINILYPPEISLICRRKVIETYTFNISCNVTEGNPNTTAIMWILQNEDREFIVSSTSNLELNSVKRKNEGSYACLANNTMKPTFGKPVYGEANQSFYLEVLYPTKHVDVSFNSSFLNVTNMTTQVNITENSSASVTLSCNADGNPLPDFYDWSGRLCNSSSIITFNAEKEFAGTYSCTAKNTLIDDDGIMVSGHTIMSYHIDILYPPSISLLPNYTVLEGDETNISCLLIPGKTTQESQSWITNTGEVFNGRDLVIKNVQRNKTGGYICKLNYTMTPTYGGSKTDVKNKTTYLNVLFPPKHVTITMNGVSIDTITVSGKLSLIENETFNLQLHCSATGNPDPTFSWTGPYEKQKGTISFNATRYNNGSYTCCARNIMNLTAKYPMVGEQNRTVIVELLCMFLSFLLNLLYKQTCFKTPVRKD